MREIAILKKLNHRNVVHLFEIINDEENNKIYLVMEYASKGSIMEYDEFEETFRINKNYRNDLSNKQGYTEEEIKDHLRNIINGLDYCNCFVCNVFSAYQWCNS